jgi:hypothetical protein
MDWKSIIKWVLELLLDLINDPDFKIGKKQVK